jgi:quinolinate synthase
MITAASLYDRLKSTIAEELSDQQFRLKAEIAEEIIRLKQEKNVLILAHNYVDPALFHTVPDITGDSLELSRKASETNSDIILVCGVSFMAETAKLLNPDKKVLIPVLDAGCSLAESVTADDVRKLKQSYPGVSVAAYINTYADLKAEIDICVTSGNAEQVLRSLPDEKVIFLPDEYLAANIAKTVDKEIISWKGRCEVHEKFSLSQLQQIRSKHPEAVILAHPECPPELVSA